MIASKADLEVIDDNYYQSGLNINQRIARDKYAAKAGIRANLMIAPDSETVTLYLFEDSLNPTEVQLNLAATGNTSLDRVVHLKNQGQQLYQGQLTLGSPARYYIELLDSNQQWRLSGQAILPAAEPIQLIATAQE